MANLSSLLERSAQAHPDRTAVVLGETRLTYAQVDAASNQVANLLVSRGIDLGVRQPGRAQHHRRTVRVGLRGALEE